MNINDSDIYAGISSLSLPVDRFEFGSGITISKTYAHVMAPYLAAFKPALPGRPHPTPWKAVGGGLGFDINAELFIPNDFQEIRSFDRINMLMVNEFVSR